MGHRANDEWVRRARAASILGVGPQGLQSLIDAGRITRRDIPGVGYQLLLRADIERIASESTVSANTAG